MRSGAVCGATSNPASGAFATPDLLNEASFETGFDGFTDGGAGNPSGIVRDGTLAAPGGGSTSLMASWVPNPSTEQGSNCYYTFGPQDHIWFRAYVRVTAPIEDQKFVRFFDPNNGVNFGGFFMTGSKLTFFTDRENNTAGNGMVTVSPAICDSAWHCIEMEYWRNGDPSGWPSAAFWTDNVQWTHADATVDSDDPGSASPASTAYWSGNRLYQGARASSNQLKQVGVFLTLNAGVTTTGQENIDRVCVSTLGRIGP